MDQSDKLTSRSDHPVHTFNARPFLLLRDLNHETAADTFGDKHLNVFVGVYQGVGKKGERCRENANDIADGHPRQDVPAQHLKDRCDCL